MNDIALGQYYPTNSILHQLDPRVKFVGTLVYIICLFLVKGPLGYLFCCLVLAALVMLSKVPARLVLKSLKPVLFILVITMMFNIFLTPGEVTWHWGILRVTKEGILTAVKMGVRLTFLVTGSSVMTLTTTPNALTDGMEKLFGFLKKVRVPVHEISMMMSIALRFIPILMEETDKIRKAQIARGADFESGNLIARAKAMIPILIPLFVSAFRRADELAMAMESRCYHGGEGRTKLHQLKFKTGDLLAVLITLAFIVFILLMQRFFPGLI